MWVLNKYFFEKDLKDWLEVFYFVFHSQNWTQCWNGNYNFIIYVNCMLVRVRHTICCNPSFVDLVTENKKRSRIGMTNGCCKVKWVVTTYTLEKKGLRLAIIMQILPLNIKRVPERNVTKCASNYLMPFELYSVTRYPSWYYKERDHKHGCCVICHLCSFFGNDLIIL